jgi:hypothetical protein
VEIVDHGHRGLGHLGLVLESDPARYSNPRLSSVIRQYGDPRHVIDPVYLREVAELLVREVIDVTEETPVSRLWGQTLDPLLEKPLVVGADRPKQYAGSVAEKAFDRLRS